MFASQMIVLAGGALFIAFLAWFFFGSKRSVSAREEEGVQIVDVRVEGTYQPDRITVEAGRPVRFRFNRQEDASCSDTVVFPDFGITRPLKAFKTTEVEFTPATPGEYPFSCA